MSFISFFTLLTGWLFQSAAPNSVPPLKHHFVVIAHRGSHLIYPENTLSAYRQAIADGADYIEIDLRTTIDGQLVSMHDATVNRTTDGTGLVKDMALADLKKLHVSKKDSTAVKEDEIPTFNQILQLCRNRIYIYIDFKDADASAAYIALQQYHMEKQALIYINKPDQFVAWRKAAPLMPLMVSLPDSAKNITAMKLFLDQYKPDILDGDYKQYTPEMLELAKAYHLPVWPDAQSRDEGPAVWDNALAKGLTGLQTDHPMQLVKYLKEKSLR